MSINHTGMAQMGDFEYAGIYCKRDGRVYDGQYDIRALLEGDAEAMIYQSNSASLRDRPLEAPP